MTNEHDGHGAADEEETSREAEGGVSIGRLSGGGVASGYRARAEDRSERVGLPPDAGPAGVPVPVPPTAAGRVSVGTMTGGAVAAGRESTALDASRQLISPSPELVIALRLLREELPLRQGEDNGTDVIDAELVGVTDEIARTGHAERGRLERLRTLLIGGGTAAAGLASALAVVQAIAQLLG